jgi:spore germination protein YaaH
MTVRSARSRALDLERRALAAWTPGAVTALFFTSLANADAPRLAPPAQPPTSIHELDLRTRPGLSRAPSWIDPRGPVAPLARRTATLTREVHGYHPYWLGGAYLAYDWSLLSTIAFFSLELDATGAITNHHGWPWNTLVSTAHQNGVRVIVTATLFSASALDALLSSPANRQNAISNLTDAVLAGGADGVNVDFEGVPGSRKQDLVTFLGELRAALEASLASPYLSIATPAVDWANAFDYDELAARCDHLMIMAYDFHWYGSSTTGPVSPLAGWGAHNVTWTVQDYQTWGALPGQMLLGVPYYGYRWPAVSGAPGAATTADGDARIYDQARTDADLHGALWDVPSSTPWYRYQNPNWLQGWFDDEASLAAKYDLVLAEDLAGVGIWALGYDGARPELWSALQDAFGAGTGAGVPPPAGTPLWIANAGPNPFRDAARFRFGLASPAAARVLVVDAAGRRVRELFDGLAPASARLVTWDGRDTAGLDAAPGIYFVRLQSGGRVAVSKAVKIR